MEDDLVKRAASIAEYTDTSIFVQERVENGAEAPPEWFGLNPAEGEDSAEEIASSDEGEGEEGKDDEDAAPDRASSNDAETRQPVTPPAGTADSANLPNSPVVPLA